MASFRLNTARRAQPHAKLPRQLGAAVVGATLALSACSWSRFADLEDGANVLPLPPPSNGPAGFGAGLAALRGGRPMAVVAPARSTRRAVSYVLGTGEPQNDDLGHCAEVPCFTAKQPAAIAAAETVGASPLTECFYTGLGIATGATSYGLQYRCSMGPAALTQFGQRPIPSGLDALIQRAIDSITPGTVLIAAEPQADAALAVSFVEAKAAWVYGPASAEPHSITLPTDADASIGSSLAVVRDGKDTLVLIGEPTAGRVHAFAWTGTAVVARGCLTGQQGFGRTLAAASLTAGASPTIAIGTRNDVRLVPSAQFTAGACQAATPSTTVNCVASGELGNCDVADFGASLAFGDLNADGNQELVVGAPGFAVGENLRAGAVLVYSLGPSSATLADTLYSSFAAADGALGVSVVTVPLGTRDVVVAGQPGQGRALQFLCGALVPAGEQNGRCAR